MEPTSTDRQFGGSIPQLYEQYLVPLIFEPYAIDLAARVVARRPARETDSAGSRSRVMR